LSSKIDAKIGVKMVDPNFVGFLVGTKKFGIRGEKIFLVAFPIKFDEIRFIFKI